MPSVRSAGAHDVPALRKPSRQSDFRTAAGREAGAGRAGLHAAWWWHPHRDPTGGLTLLLRRQTRGEDSHRTDKAQLP
jgi:hypothetical protein